MPVSRNRLSSAIVVLASLLWFAPTAGAAPGNWPGRPFSPSSVWNAPLARRAPLAAQSGAYVHELRRQVSTYGPWLNTYAYSVAVYVVGADQPTRRVVLDAWGPDLQTAFDAVPIPARARAALGTDQELTVWQPSTNRLWDFWKMHEVGAQWRARWGGEMPDVSDNPGYFTHTGVSRNWGATATGLPLLGGLITFADLRRGYINHALAMSLVETAPRVFAWPAQRTDGGAFTHGITAIPEGTRFRLNPSLNLARMHLAPLDLMLARAAQKYGIVVRDKAGAVVFMGQAPISSASNPWPAVFGHEHVSQILQRFPWGHLQALRDPTYCCWAR